MPRDDSDALAADRIRLTHMIEAADRAIRFCAGLTREAIEADEMRLLAVIKSIEIMGEASTKVSAGTKSRLPGIDWHGVRRMRNRMIHGYDTIDTVIVWDAIQLEIPPLVLVLKSAIEAWPEID
jgi:uncharacterized protein with HEPN domain